MLISFKNRGTICTDDENSDGNSSWSSSSSSSSSSVVASNVDLLRQILLCLPVKSLLVSKSVSKQWLSLISDPSFIQNHYLQNCLSTHGLIFREFSISKYNPEKYKIFFNNGNTNSGGIGTPFQTLTLGETSVVEIEHSCNGLLCCRRFHYEDRNEVTIYVYNPSTKHYRILPPSQFSTNCMLRSCNVTLAFDPLKSPYYQAIYIWENLAEKEYHIEIYSSETDSWRLYGDVIPAKVCNFYNSCVFWNGSLHWIDLEENMLGVYFDVGKDVIGKIPLPSIPDEYREDWELEYFGECRGHLHLVISYDQGNTRLDVLEIDTDYTGWNMKYSVNLEGLLITYPLIVGGCFEFSVLLVEEEEDKSSKLVLEILNNRDVISYDLKGLGFKKIHNLSTGDGIDEIIKGYRFNACQYIETLAGV